MNEKQAQQLAFAGTIFIVGYTFGLRKAKALVRIRMNRFETMITNSIENIVHQGLNPETTDEDMDRIVEEEISFIRIVGEQQ